MTLQQIAKRVAALEADVATLKRKPKRRVLWWNKIAGKFAGDPLFSEAMQEGRKWRTGQQMKSNGSKKRDLKRDDG